MTREEKLQLNRDRQQAVREAWAREKALVQQGKGTVDWSPSQQAELMKTGRVSGYEGQHMKSVSRHPQYAASADNIQLLTHQQHLDAHNSGSQKSGYRSPTNGRYDPATGQMHAFGNHAPAPVAARSLSQPCFQGSSHAAGQSGSPAASPAAGKGAGAGGAGHGAAPGQGSGPGASPGGPSAGTGQGGGKGMSR